MKTIWTGIIKPIIEALNPRIIIELGIYNDKNTRNIIEYCFNNNSKLISIDPFPDSFTVELEYKYGKYFTLIRDSSLNVLQTIQNIDVILINVDKNWDLISQILMIIQENAKDHFPLIIFNHLKGPNTKIDPNNNAYDIQPKFTGKNEDKIALNNDNLTNKYIISNSNGKNGFSHAVKDFLNNSDFELNFFNIYGFNELAIIYDQKSYSENAEFSTTIDDMIVEVEHNDNYIHKINNYDLLNQNILLKRDISSTEKLNKELLEQNIILEDKLELLNSHFDNLDGELDKSYDYVKNLLKTNKNQIWNILSKKNEEIGILESKLSQAYNDLDMLTLSLKTLSFSKKRDFYKNFQTLFPEYSSNKSSMGKGRFASLSKIPYLFMLLKSKGNIRNAWVNIKAYRNIKESELFDEDYYLNTYKNVLISGINPLIHYMNYGYKENKLPSTIFDGEYYLNTYEDVKASGMNPLVYYSLFGIEQGHEINKRTKVSVIVTSYNHEKYIRQCIDSILMQKDVDFELIIGDDCSEDNTRNILEEYQEQNPSIINLLPKTENIGVTNNIKRCLDAVTGEYVAFCEGDDYWTDALKLKKQSEFLGEREDCSMCFNSFILFHENALEKNRNHQKKLTKEIYKTRDLILDNFIGNFSCCMYRTSVIKKLKDSLFDLFVVDWMFNIACSEHGNIGFLKENMSVYRIHDNGLWSSRDFDNQYSELLELIKVYNQFFSYKYDYEFKENEQHRNIKLLQDRAKYNKTSFKDIIILDNMFPHPLSAFRLQEFNSYLEHFKNIKIYSNGKAFNAIKETRSIDTIIEDYKKEYPQFKNKVKKFDADKQLNAKLIYTEFMTNAHFFLDTIEKNKIPFVFTLYPNGEFQLNNQNSDLKLRRVFNSPYFKKVIVTQKITYDYLVNNNFCKAEQIEEIFSIVTPLELINKESNDKKYYDQDKSCMDICFVACKYTKKGIDKGYNIFIEVANELAKKYENINFHVVGNFDENVIDTPELKNRIKFYGPQSSEWFNEFYKDKDIILSPNMPFKLLDGAFDGFPTDCCTEAGLHKVAIFCNDTLNQNTEKYKDKEEIVLIPDDNKKIVEILEEYYHNPEKLRNISEKGYLKSKEIYNYENQITPRIKLLNDILGDSNK